MGETRNPRSLRSPTYGQNGSMQPFGNTSSSPAPILRADTGAFGEPTGGPQPAGTGMTPFASGVINRMGPTPNSAMTLQDRVRTARDRARSFAGRPPASPVYNPDGSVANSGVQKIGESFWSGDTLKVDTSNQQYAPLRNRLQQTLMGRMDGISAQRPQGPDSLAAPGPFNMDFSNLPEISRSMVRDVNGPNMGRGDMVRADRISSDGTNIDSVDQLGGNFFDSMMSRYQPIFDQQRARALAQAKEAAGNLTGTGYAEHLGRAVNRSLMDEQAQMLNFANQGIDRELSRQGQLAGFAQQRNLAQPELNMRARLANQSTRQSYDLSGAELGSRANLANQGADMNFVNSLLQRGGLDLNRDQLRLNSGVANLENTRAYDLARGQLGMDRYRTDADLSNADAQRLTSLLGSLGTAGIGQDDLIQTGGAGAILPALGGLLGGSGLLSGGGSDGKGNWGTVGDILGRIGGGGNGSGGRGSAVADFARGASVVGAFPAAAGSVINGIANSIYGPYNPERAMKSSQTLKDRFGTNAGTWLFGQRAR